MKKQFNKNFATLMFLVAILIVPSAIFAQTKVSMPKNKNSKSKDIELGRKTAAQVEQTFPILNDRVSEAYINEVGMRLANAVPPEFQHREFNCQFKIVNASDINAFALPGCWLYVNRGMIEAARNEGEMAGVMAHEIAHAMLRHGTAQGPSAWTQIGALGAILGGAIVGAPELGQVAAAGLITPYSRNFEKQADIVGANIMARAGYDPRDLANMFRTIAGENGGARAPEWVSSHPDPGNRYNYINQEAAMLRVSSNPIKFTPGFQRAQNYMRSLPKAPTMAEIEKRSQGQQGGGQSPTSGGQYSRNVPYPSTSYRNYNAGNILSTRVPSNWREFPVQNQNEVWFAPEGAYGDDGITHGALIGVAKGTGNLQQDTQNYLNSILQANPNFRQQGGFSNGRISGRTAYATTIAGTSPTTGQTEVDTVYTTQLRDGSLLYVVTVAPQNDASNYSVAFRNLINSIRINDR